MNSDLDEIDRGILTLLRSNSRLPVSSLAAGLKISRATVQNRIDRLLQREIILGFTVRLCGDESFSPVRAVMSIEIRGKPTSPILKALRGFPEVRTVHTTNGRWDMVAELRADTLDQFDRALSGIRRIEGVASTETNLLLSTHNV
jgi:DNA-binding Lrp family transcriptional regulator